MAKKFFVPILKLPPGILNVNSSGDCIRRGHDECWPWTGATSGGYGIVRLPKELGGKSVGAHRIAYAAAHPERFRDDLPVRRMCEMRGCVNPAHLFQRGMVGRYAHNRVMPKKVTRLTFGSVRTIERWHKEGMPIAALANIYHITEAEIERILRKKRQR